MASASHAARAAFLCALIAPHAALAQIAEWSLSVEADMDANVASTDKAAEFIDLYPTIEAGLTVNATEWLSLNGHAVLEPVSDPVDDRVFEDLGLYVDDLFATVHRDGIEVSAGKLGVPFGVAWDAAPGIYGTDFAEDYETSEQIGAVVQVSLAGLPGAPVLSIAAFMADRTFLSDSLGESRGPLRLSDGGAGNTEGPENFAVALDGSAGDDWAWNVGLRRLAAGQGDPEDELGLVAGVTHDMALTPDTGLALIGEGAWFANAGGGTADALYLTAGAAVARGPWEVSAVYALRDYDGADTDHLGTVTLGYAITETVAAGVAYRLGREGGETTHTIGLALVAEFGGSL